MRELRFVTPGEDTGHVVVESQATIGGDAEQFLLLLTDELRAALLNGPSTEVVAESAVRRPLPTAAPAPVASEPAISPREIQVRVRSGEKPEEIAELFDADLKWVMRFAGPVIEERGRLTDEARRARARRSTADAQTVIFGETVDARFSAHGIDPVLVLWDSHRREDGQWVISAHWVGGESERTAEWTFNLSARTVTAIDETATDLLSDRPIRPVFAEAPVTLTTAPPLAPGVVAFPAMPGAHTGPLPTREQLFDQQRFDGGPRAVPPMPAVSIAPAPAIAPAVSLAPAASPAPAPVLPARVAQPELELGMDFELEQELELEPAFDLAEEPAEEPSENEMTRIPQVTNLGIAHRDAPPAAETEDERAARAHIPSWDDILLGVRRKND